MRFKSHLKKLNFIKFLILSIILKQCVKLQHQIPHLKPGPYILIWVIWKTAWLLFRVGVFITPYNTILFHACNPGTAVSSCDSALGSWEVTSGQPCSRLVLSTGMILGVNSILAWSGLRHIKFTPHLGNLDRKKILFGFLIKISLCVYIQMILLLNIS